MTCATAPIVLRDGVGDVCDGCVDDSNKTEPGECGCGVAENGCGWSYAEDFETYADWLDRHGIDQLLPTPIRLVHGPGCPVCVTPLETIDRALAIAPAHADSLDERSRRHDRREARAVL